MAANNSNITDAFEDPALSSHSYLNSSTDNRYSGLFDTPANSAPVIISLVSEPGSFNSLTLQKKKAFISSLIGIIGSVKPDTKWSPRGEVYIYPTWKRQKEKLLSLKVVDEFIIKCSRAKSETESKGIIHIPTHNTEDDVLQLLSDQHVTAVKRFYKQISDSTKTPLTAMVLFFDTPTIPREVTIAHELFPVSKFIPRPTMCYKCWRMGHTEDNCRSPPRCKRCGADHGIDDSCKTPAVCPTCGKGGHTAGTPLCPIYANRQKVIKYAYDNEIPIPEASRILNGQDSAPLTKVAPQPATQNDEYHKLKEDVESLKAQLASIQSAPPIEPPMSRIVEERFERLEHQVQSLETSIKPLVATAMEEGFRRIEAMIGSQFAQFANTAQLHQAKNTARPPAADGDTLQSPKRPKTVSPTASQNYPTKYLKPSDSTSRQTTRK